MIYLYQWLIIVLSASLFVFCDYLSTNWARTNNMNSIVLVFVLGPIAYILFGLLTRIKSVSISSGIVNMFLLIGTILVGIFIFKDHLDIKQIFGLILALIAVILMN
jgi:multidrug transporter EmrE-like cation transporter